MNSKKFYLNILLSIVVTLVLYFIYTNTVLEPSNNRNWEVGFEKLPQITVTGDLVTINDLRDYHYAPGKFVGTNYLNRTVDLNNLERAWFVVEPFEGFPVIKFDGIAHTYFVFDFANEKPIVVSVEARREKGEQFGLTKGLLNSFELMYVWGTEEDLTQRRVLIENNKLYMYPLTISNDSAKKLFLQLANTSQAIETEPRFYNSLTSNCTNELAKNANLIKPGTIPFNVNWFLPGYADAELHKLGFIPNGKPLEEVREQYYISDLVKEHADKPDFSELLRSELFKESE